MSRRVAAVVTVSVLIAFAGCSSGEGSDTVGSGASTPARASSAPTTATTTPATVPLSPASSPSEAATAFINAWRAGNRLLASTVAEAGAVDSAFGAGDPGSVENRGCNQPPTPDSPVLCVYRTDVGEVQVRVQPQSGGWIVDQARVSPA